jgi:hypothetical protein
MTERHRLGVALALLGAASFVSPPTRADAPASGYLKTAISADHSTLLFLGVDSLGKGEDRQNLLQEASARGGSNAGWTVETASREIRLTSADPSAPFALTIDTHVCHASLLGVFDSSGRIVLPAVLHLPGYGTLRVTSDLRGAGGGGRAGPPGGARAGF